MAWQSGARWRASSAAWGSRWQPPARPWRSSRITYRRPPRRCRSGATLDPHHWSVSFDVSHFGYSRFTMRFDKASAVLDWRAGGPAMSQVSATIDASSLDTNVPILDRMVTGSDALDAARYPSIRFDSTGWTPTGENTGKLAGNLTIRGTTKPITLAVTFNGYGRNPLTKQPTVGFSASGSFSRAAFDIPTWYPAVGDDVRVRIEAEFEMLPAGGDGAASPAQ